MTGAMIKSFIFIPNRKNDGEVDAITIKNMMKIKVIKKHNNLPLMF